MIEVVISCERFGEDVYGLGAQVIAWIRAVERCAGPLLWFGANRRWAPNPSYTTDDSFAAVPLGTTDDVVTGIPRDTQFEAGVWVAFRADGSPIELRAPELDTEDDDPTSMGTAIFELRAFDTSFWLLASSVSGLVARVIIEAPRLYLESPAPRNGRA